MQSPLVEAAAPDKAVVYEIGDDEAGMRLDRWLRRRFPDLPQSHLMKIVRKGEVRVVRQAGGCVDAARGGRARARSAAAAPGGARGRRSSARIPATSRRSAR